MRRVARLPTGATLLLGGLIAFTAVQARNTERGPEYTGPNRMVTLRVPRAPNWAGVPYTVTPLDTKGDLRYDKVLLHADDFGQYLVVGVRVMPTPAIAEMDRDEPRLVLKKLSEATLMGWRTDLEALPGVLDESFRDSRHGDAITRVYRAKKGSILVRATGRQPALDDAFDTNIVSIVARRGPVVVFVLAQNDTSPDDPEHAVKMAAALFDDLTVASVR